MMLWKIAYRNIWRHPSRSAIVVAAMVLGIWGGTFIISFFMGMTQQQLADMLRQEVSHIQVHNPLFSDQIQPHHTLHSTSSWTADLTDDSRIEAFSARVIGAGLIASPRLTVGGLAVGIDPAAETAVTRLGDRLIEGELFAADRKHPVVIGSRLADRLQVSLNSKIVLTLPDTEGEMVSTALRITGIFQERSAAKSAAKIYLPAEDLAALLGVGTARHELAIYLNNPDDVPALEQELQAAHPEDLVRSWKKISPELRMIAESYDAYVLVIIGIILLALLFGIVNSMLMAVLERTRELGVLMAVGLTRRKVFAMILLETLMIGTVGGPLGLLIAWATITMTARTGVDLSMYGDGLEAYGFSTHIYPQLPAETYFTILAMVIGAAFLAAIFPAYRAIRLQPMEAIHSA